MLYALIRYIPFAIDQIREAIPHFKFSQSKTARTVLTLQQIVDSRRDLVPLELLFLIKSGHNTGYTIKKAYERYFGINVSFGTIYPLLHSLHKGGFLTRKTHSGRATKVYTLSREGQRALELNASFVKTFSKVLSRPNQAQKIVKIEP